MYGTSMRENREIPPSPRLLITGWVAQGTQGGTPEMHERGKSDRFVVPANPPNKATAAEVGEERERAKGNTDGKTRPGPSAGTDASNALGRVREVARRDKDARFTALLHHVTPSRLRQAYWAISPKAAPGVDWVTWDDYGRNLEANLLDLHGRVQSGGYRAKPSRRAYIPKPDGRLRPLGIASLEDKIVQRAVVEVLNAVYEVDFRGFSYGFRPGRGPHDALDALAVGIERKRVNWVLDADIRNFFGQIDHSWLRRFVEHRIADKRIWRLIGKWLAAGVIEDGQWSACEEGSPQGASASPLLANVYLHYVFDLWADHWRRHHAGGDVLRRTGQFQRGIGLPVPGQPALAAYATAAQPARPDHLGADGQIRNSVAPASPCDASLPERALRSQNLRQEPDAIVPHVGIRAGGRP